MKNNSESFKQFISNYWNYYIELEREFLSIRKYVDFCVNNFKTYSIEFLKLYQTICSEIDVLGKAMAQEVNPGFKPEEKSNNILKWWYEIQNIYQIPKDGCNVRLADTSERFLDMFSISPWKDFFITQRVSAKGSIYYSANNSTPKWWKEYNDVKHHRTFKTSEESVKTNYTKANFENVCYSLTALYILEIAYMHYLGTKDNIESFYNESEAFVMKEFVTTSEIDKMFLGVTE